MVYSCHILSAERSLCLNVKTTNIHGGGDQILENSENFEKIQIGIKVAILDLLYGGYLELLLVVPSNHLVRGGKKRNLMFEVCFECFIQYEQRIVSPLGIFSKHWLPLATTHLVGDNKEFEVSGIF